MAKHLLRVDTLSLSASYLIALYRASISKCMARLYYPGRYSAARPPPPLRIALSLLQTSSLYEHCICPSTLVFLLWFLLLMLNCTWERHSIVSTKLYVQPSEFKVWYVVHRFLSSFLSASYFSSSSDDTPHVTHDWRSKAGMARGEQQAEARWHSKFLAHVLHQALWAI